MSLYQWSENRTEFAEHAEAVGVRTDQVVGVNYLPEGHPDYPHFLVLSTPNLPPESEMDMDSIKAGTPDGMEMARIRINRCTRDEDGIIRRADFPQYPDGRWLNDEELLATVSVLNGTLDEDRDG